MCNPPRNNKLKSENFESEMLNISIDTSCCVYARVDEEGEA